MCGINGIFAYHCAASLIDRGELVRTRDHMAARGPDGKGEWIADGERVGFGHRRLSIIELSDAGAQPMPNADGTLVVTFNGEIYNHRELRRGLEAKGYVFRSNSDTEVLLHLYAENGEAMVHDLRGMFAFAIWDARRRKLFLARDPYGIKPLYYADDGWTFRFASQVKALVAGGAVSTDPEPAGVVGFHLWGHVPEPFTLYREIVALPAGHTLMVDGIGPARPRPYTSIAATIAAARSEPMPVEDCRRLIARGVRDSVAHHMLADVEVGVFLSAGIDSGAMLGLAREVAAAPPRAITLAFADFRGTRDDEAPLAAEVAQLYGARHMIRTVDRAEFEADLPRILAAMDQPSIDGVNTWFVSKAAREAGLKVALSGLGGDELLAGYPSFSDIPRWRRRYGWLQFLPGTGRLARTLVGTLAPGLSRRSPKAPFMIEHAGSWEGAYLLRRGLFLPGELHSLLDAEQIKWGLRRLSPLQRLRKTLSPDPGSDMGRVCALESSHYMRDQLLRDADWAGMAHSLEIRTPLVDSALLATVAPIISQLQPGEGKRALASAPSVPLPGTITDRAKTGFVVPTARWMASTLARDTAPGGSDPIPNGVVSRHWGRHVLSELTSGAGAHAAA